MTAGEEDRHFVAIVENVVVGLVPVAQGVEELAEPPALAVDARPVPALACELAAELEIIAGEGTEGFTGGSGSGARAVLPIRLLAPPGDGVPYVSAEDFGEVVLAVELVLVVDAGERGRGLGGHLVSPFLFPFRARRRRHRTTVPID